VKTLLLVWKNIKEQARDSVTLGLSLIIGPFFVLLYWLMIPSGSTAYGVLVQNLDRGIHGQAVIEAMKELSYPSGDHLLEVRLVDNRDSAKRSLRDRDAEVLIIIPADFSKKISLVQSGEDFSSAEVTLIGDLTNPYYAVGAVMASSVVDEYSKIAASENRAIQFDEIALGGSAGRSEFDLYIPGLLIISVVMLVFLVAMSISQEIESGTLSRLQLSGIKAFELVIGLSLPTVIFGILSLLITLLVAVGLGFQANGSILLAIIIGGLTSIAVVGVGLIVAAYSQSVSRAFIIANFPLIFFMFFSGAVYPIPRILVGRIWGIPVSIYDIFPPTHAVVALNKILTLGSGISGVAYELISLALLSVLYYGIGIWLFWRRHLSIGS
jgi:ABC-2 type transport system permease protein